MRGGSLSDLNHARMQLWNELLMDCAARTWVAHNDLLSCLGQWLRGSSRQRSKKAAEDYVLKESK